MPDTWFYATREGQFGPFTLKELKDELKALPTEQEVYVWREGFPDWKPAKEVTELARLPPPFNPKPIPRSEPQAPKRRFWIATSAALIFVVCVIGALSTIIYGNSAGGMGYLTGQLVVPLALGLALTFPVRKSPYTLASVLCVAALLTAITNIKELSTALEGRQSLSLLEDTSPSDIETVLAQNPSNRLLQLFAEAYRASTESGLLFQKLSEELDELSDGPVSPANFARVGREQLQTYQRNLERAQTNADAALPRFAEILAKERTRVENFAQSVHVDDEVGRGLLRGIDDRHSKNIAFNRRMLAARVELYEAGANSVSILVQNYGSFRVQSNGFEFSNQEEAKRFNNAAAEVNAALGRIAQLDQERQQILQSQNASWRQLFNSH